MEKRTSHFTVTDSDHRDAALSTLDNAMVYHERRGLAASMTIGATILDERHLPARADIDRLAAEHHFTVEDFSTSRGIEASRDIHVTIRPAGMMVAA